MAAAGASSFLAVRTRHYSNPGIVFDLYRSSPMPAESPLLAVLASIWLNLPS